MPGEARVEVGPALFHIDDEELHPETRARRAPRWSSASCSRSLRTRPPARSREPSVAHLSSGPPGGFPSRESIQFGIPGERGRKSGVHGRADQRKRLHPRDRRERSGVGQARRPRRHALSARAERLPPHRPRQVDLPELRHRRGERGRRLPPALRRHQSQRRGGGVRRVDQGGRALARLRLGRAPVLRLGLLRAALRLRRPADRGRQGLRLRPERRGAHGLPRDPHRARSQQPLPRPHGRGEPRPLRAHAGRRVRERRARAAGQDRHGVAEPHHARPHPLPDPQGAPPPHRRRLVHLPDVRLRPLPVRLHRGHHPLALHARVRGPPPALRLVPRRARHAAATRSRSSSPGST